MVIRWKIERGSLKTNWCQQQEYVKKLEIKFTNVRHGQISCLGPDLHPLGAPKLITFIIQEV